MNNTITLDALCSGELLEMTSTPNTALGEGGSIEIYGNKLAGHIVVNTGCNSSGKTACTINFPEGNGLGTDVANVFIESNDGKFFQVVAQAVDSNGFEIYSKELWEDNTSYEFKYFIVAHIQ